MICVGFKRMDRQKLRQMNIAWGAAALVLAVGIFWGFQRGTPDFNVFYTAWTHVLQGASEKIYTDSPDRFLYAPGFAWALSPLALLPKSIAFLVWSALKAAVLILLVHKLARRFTRAPTLAPLAFAIVARPLLIDFQYGQINSLLVGLAGLFLLELLPHKSAQHTRAKTRALSFAFGFLAAGKLLLLPLLAATTTSRPLSANGWKHKMRALCWCAIGAAAALFPWSPDCLNEWMLALQSRGLPLESHNQSFVAFLYHWLSGQPTPVILLARTIQNGWELLTPPQIHLIGGLWAAAWFAFLAWWSWGKKPRQIALIRPDAWIALALAAVILPSHLVWKPYFVFTLPIAAIALCERRWVASAAVFLFLNFTSADFIGPERAGAIESMAPFLWAHLILFFIVARHAPSETAAHKK